MAMEIVVDDLGNDADAEEEGFEDDDVEEEETQESGGAARAASMPGTPDHAAAAAAAAAGKEYASESEAAWMVGGRRQGNYHHQQQQQQQQRRRRRRRTMSAQRRRENWVERAWEMRRSVMRDRNENRNRRVLVPPPEEEDEEDRRAEWMRMDLEEVQACRDLGLGLPPAWTLELPYGLSGGETSSGGNSPCGSWRISSPGDDPREVKARLKAWAQAVVLASASHLQN